MHTKENAEKIYCPVGFVIKAAVTCIGPQCMAWRWATPVSVSGDRLINPASQPGQPIEPLGYCGLAGKP